MMRGNRWLFLKTISILADVTSLYFVRKFSFGSPAVLRLSNFRWSWLRRRDSWRNNRSRLSGGDSGHWRGSSKSLKKVSCQPLDHPNFGSHTLNSPTVPAPWPEDVCMSLLSYNRIYTCPSSRVLPIWCWCAIVEGWPVGQHRSLLGGNRQLRRSSALLELPGASWICSWQHQLRRRVFPWLSFTKNPWRKNVNKL